MHANRLTKQSMMQKNFRLIVLTMFLQLLISCRNENPCALSKEAMRDLKVLDSMAQDPVARQIHAAFLEVNYKEPLLLEAERETYRFIFSSSMDTSMIWRIEDWDGHYKLTHKVFVSHEDTVGRVSELELTQNQWNHVVNRLEELNFWIYPTTIQRQGLDGAVWTLEGYKTVKDKCSQRNYHIVSRWSPVDTSFIAMCKLLEKLNEK